MEERRSAVPSMKSPMSGSRSMAGTRTRISLTLLIPTDITSFVHRSIQNKKEKRERVHQKKRLIDNPIDVYVDEWRLRASQRGQEMVGYTESGWK